MYAGRRTGGRCVSPPKRASCYVTKSYSKQFTSHQLKIHAIDSLKGSAPVPLQRRSSRRIARVVPVAALPPQEVFQNALAPAALPGLVNLVSSPL